jgi:FkbM family methyltransferase
MNFLKRIIFKILGVKAYLRVISSLFFVAYYCGFLKGKKNYDCHYIVRKLIKEGDVIIDLGANLGYYSRIFSKLTGKNGKVYSIEPVELFRTILSKNTRKQSNVEIIPYAIGTTDNEKIKMGVPAASGYFSHGRTHILSKEEECSMVFDATIMRPDTIFKNLKKLDYLKCDIEEYEHIAIPMFKELFVRFKPLLQIEIGDENRNELFLFLKGLDYSVFEVKGDRLRRVPDQNSKTFGDLIFINNQKVDQYDSLIDS